jgi:hypothetical protein
MAFLAKIMCLFLAAALSAVSAAAETAGAEITAVFYLEAGRAEPVPGCGPNAQGVYPVRLRWRRPAGLEPAAYAVYQSSGADGEFRARGAVTAEPGGFFAFIHENPAAAPGIPYYYRVLALNAAGEGLAWSEPRMGYGALTHTQYLLEYNKTVKSSHRRLTLMHQRRALSKLGAETQNGAISGSVSYEARIAGLGARVIIRYEHYADFYIPGEPAREPRWIISGEMNTSASLNQSGRMDGTVEAGGMYPGKVFYDNILIKDGGAAGGTYGVEPTGFPRAELSWTLGE